MGHVRSLFRNPISQAIIALLLAIILTWLSVKLDERHIVIWSKVSESLAAALLVYSIFGIAFEYIGKRDLISSVVDVAVGASKSNSFGLSDVELSALQINYRSDIFSSSELIVSSRYSAHFFERYRDEILARLRSGRKTTVVRMVDQELTRMLPAYSSPKAVDEFFRKITFSEPNLKPLVDISEYGNIFNYNFVVVDRGVWIKFYWNAARADTPPAIFVSTGTELYSRWRGDIDKVLISSKKVIL